MGRKFIDLSIAIESGEHSDPPGYGPKVQYMNHKDTLDQLGMFFSGLEPKDLPDEESWAVEWVELSTHSGTHMDAPWHYHSTQDAMLPSGKRPSMTIDEMPLDWCYRPGVKLDFRKFEDGYVATADDIRAELDRIEYTLKPFDIVLVNTSAAAAFGKPEYLATGCGMGREATLFLAEAGVKVVGTDAWSWDAPFIHTAKKWEETKDPSIIWEGHKAGKDIGYFQIEKLHNLEALPPHGFDFLCFPIKIKSSGAGWIRAVALLEE